MSEFEMKRSSSEEDVEIIACTEEQVAPIRRLCRTSPQRVVDMIRTHATAETPQVVKNIKGNKEGNVIAALAAVGELVKGVNVGPDKMAIWTKLIDAGVVDSLVYNILNGKTFIETLPGMPEDLKERAMNQIQAPYYVAMEILSNASRFINRDSLSPQDTIFISALKAHWSDMMERVWDEPLNSLRPEESHVFERVVVAALFYRMIVIDPTFLDLAYKDRTIPLVTRAWAYSGTCPRQQMDAYMTSVVLCELVRPQTTHVVAYVQPRKKKLSKSRLISQMYIGAGTTPFGVKSNQTRALVEAFGSRFSKFDGRDAKLVLEMTLSLFESAQEKGTGAYGWAQEAFISESFWRGLFSLLGRIQKGRARDSGGAPTQKHLMVLPIVLVSAAFDCAEKKGRAQGQLVYTCARAGFFDVLDEVMADLLATSNALKMNVCQLLVHLFLLMRSALVHCTPEERTFLETQFPRWPTLTALFQNDIKTQMQSQASSTTPMNPLASMPAQMAWQLFATLHVGCKSMSKCARRGCDKPGSAACETCNIVKYCGPQCQKTDWKTHMVMCSRGFFTTVGRALMDVENLNMDDMIRERNSANETKTTQPTEPGLSDLD